MTKFILLINQVKQYLSRFKKQDKKRGSPKLIKATRKNVNEAGQKVQPRFSEFVSTSQRSG